mgnify:CR=1 FL=1|jgi:hypothetical protein|tara:strand:+ start:868 stop:1140 length:273 start_codon:yes stop_codon:yes gene_type:complete
MKPAMLWMPWLGNCERGEASDLFARDRGDGLASILGNSEQSMVGETLYGTREELAAHLLYFVIKNPPSGTATSAPATSRSCSTCARKACV